MPISTENILSEAAKNSGSVMNSDAEKCLGESLDPTQTVGEVLRMIHMDVEAGELGGTDNSVSNSNASQQATGDVSGANVVPEQLHVCGGESMSDESVEDGCRTSISGNGDKPGEILRSIDNKGRLPPIDGSKSCDGPGKDGGVASSCNDRRTRGKSFSLGKCKNPTNEPGEGGNFASCEVAKQSREIVSLMPTAREPHIVCHESQTRESSALEHLVDVECLKSELSDPRIVLPNSVVPEQVSETLTTTTTTTTMPNINSAFVGSREVSETLTPGENSVKKSCQLHLWNGLASLVAEFSSNALSGESRQRLRPNQNIGERQDGFGCQSLSDEPWEEKVDRQLQTNLNGKKDPEEDLSQNDHKNLSNILNSPIQPSNVISDCTFVRVTDSLGFTQASQNQGEDTHVSAHNDQPEQEVKADLDSKKEEQNAETKVEVAKTSPMDGAHRSLVEQVGKYHNDMSKNFTRIEEHRSAASNAEASPNEQARPSNEGKDEKLYVVVLGIPANDANMLRRGRSPGKTSAFSTKTEYHQLSSVSSARFLPPRTQEKHTDMSKNSCIIEKNRSAASEAEACPNQQSRPPPEEKFGKLHVVVLGTPANDPSVKPRRGRRPGKTSAFSTTKKYPLRSSRVLRSRSQDNAPETSAYLQNTSGSTGRRRGRKKKKEMKGNSDDEFSRMRKHLRYLLHRIRYEQNLLDAYSSEGWRGQSVEKLRPEKELQRAKTDINRSKLKIRDLFLRLDSISAEGKFPDSLFDSEGLIDSEDIFCANCGSKDLSSDNDIILCDGICDRGFHQYCLVPPLRTEEIPPGDEGWLCPACDCKVDCIELLNDAQGTKLSIRDSWEKVFPEALAAIASKDLHDVEELQSDDSEDNDYNPDGTNDDDKIEGSESSSDESDSDESDPSDFSSASEDLGAVCGNEQYIGLPSDDSEDDDYDPDAANVNEEQVKDEGSSSDFTSASEDIGATVGDDGTSDKDEPPGHLELDQNLGESLPLSHRRHMGTLDYKKHYDETYGNAASDSSDDEEWTDMVATRTRKSSAEKGVSISSNRDASASADGTCHEGTPQGRGREKPNLQVANGSSPAQLQESSQKTNSNGKSMKRPPYNRLGEPVTQRLYESFRENQYPNRSTKEKLADELGLRVAQVDKWFGNARWSFNHHPSRIEASISLAVSHTDTPHSVACSGPKSASTNDSTTVPEHENADSCKLDTMESGGRTPTPQKTRKRKSKESDRPMLQTSKSDISKEDTHAGSMQTPESPLGSMQRKRRKYGA